MADIRVPKLNNNDSEYVLVEWVAEDGVLVEPDEVVVTLETSKALEDVACAGGGRLRRLVSAGSSCAPGDVIGRVLAPGEEEAAPVHRPEATAEVIITGPARELMEELEIPADRVRELNLRMVRRADVQRLAESESPADVRVLPPVQQAVARSVTLSHQTIPAAHTVVQVAVGPALEQARGLTRRLHRLVGLPEFLVAAVAEVFQRFPMPFATPLDETRVRLAEAANVGVTIDVGKGLYVPVVANASGLGLGGIVEAMSELRRTAMTGSFRESDLTGANIAVTLHGDADVVLAVPFILPGTICALALAGTRQELVLGSDGAVSARTVANVGLAYDHRFVNGRDATLFLQAIKEAIEEPLRLMDDTGA